MRRKALLFLIFPALVMLLTGCWSLRELNELGIAVGMGIDKSDNGYEVSVQIVDSDEISNKRTGAGKRTPVTLYSARGSTVSEAVRRLTTITPRRTYFAHVRIFLMSEQLAKDGIGKILDYLSREHEFRTDFYFAVARGTTAKELLTLLTPLEKIPANKMFNALKTGKADWGPVAAIQLDELLNDLANNGKQAVLTGFRIWGDQAQGGTNTDVEAVEPHARLQIWGLAVFKDDKLVGWLNERESKGYSNITNQIKRSVVGVACPAGGKLAVNVIRSHTKVKGRVMNGTPKIEVTTRTEADVSDVECQIDLTKNETIAYLQKEVETRIKRDSEISIQKAKQLQSDIFGFGKAVRRANPAYWSKVKDDWDRQFANLPVDIKVDVQIRRLGTIGNPMLTEPKK